MTLNKKKTVNLSSLRNVKSEMHTTQNFFLYSFRFLIEVINI